MTVTKTSSIYFGFILILVLIATLLGWFADYTYSSNPQEIQLKSRFYDLALLLVVIPTSLFAFIRILQGRKTWIIFSLGVAAYLAFTYCVILFQNTQNNLFLIYVAIVSLSFFYIIKYVKKFNEYFSWNGLKNTTRFIATVLIFSSASGFIFWMIDAITSISFVSNQSSTISSKVPQILDMAIYLPIAFWGGLQAWSYKKNGVYTCVITSVFFILIALSVIIMEIGYSYTSNLEMDYGKVYSYCFIYIINMIATLSLFRQSSVE